MHDASSADAVVIEFPARREYLLLARTVVMSVATTLALDYETCEDLRLGVDELCAALIEGADSGGALRLELEADEASLRVTGTTRTEDASRTIELDPIARQIIHTVGDRVELRSDGAEHRFLLEKHIAG